MFYRMMVRGLLAAALVPSAVSVQADVFSMGGTISGGTWTGLASLSFVPVGDPGNTGDPADGALRSSSLHLPDGQIRRDDCTVTVSQRGGHDERSVWIV